MTLNATFAVTATGLTLLALGFVLTPLLQGGSTASTPRRGKTALALGLAVPLLAAALYGLLGSTAGLDAGPTEAAPPSGAPPSISAAQIQAMVQRLAERLKQQPDDEEGWRMLARSYETLGRYGDAAQAYASLERLRPNDATLLTEHAVTLAMSLGQQLSGEPEKLIDRALAIDPRHVQALALAGSAAYERGDYTRAVTLWRRILAQVPADADIAQSIRDSISRAEDLAKPR